MLEIRKNTFSKNYENTFFREFSRNLSKSFEKKNFQGVLIGSPSCEVDSRLQIDALLITPDVVCIIDFKNTQGKISLPDDNNFEDGHWIREDGGLIKGGSSINPFKQLKYQKRSFIDVFKRHIRENLAGSDCLDPFHVVRVVCFKENIEIDGKIPKKEEQNFFIFHKENYLAGILDIVDTKDREVRLHEEQSLNAFKNIFRANLYNFDEVVQTGVVINSSSIDYQSLREDQKIVLEKVATFLKDSEKQVFILQGTTNSGKSHLIPFIQKIADDSGVPETQIFAASGRIAKNLLSSGLENVTSIYSYIYGGIGGTSEEKKDVEESKLVIEENDLSGDLPTEIVPLKKCDNSDSALFIVDESQLVSDSYYKSIDLQFGTGKLLNDFLTFADISNKKRKIIFIGDPYQIQLGGKSEETPLNPEYLESNYKIKPETVSLQDNEGYSLINKEALKCVNGIRKNILTLSFDESDDVRFLENEDLLGCVSKMINDKVDGHILCYSNEEVQKVNYWIKKNILQNSENLAVGDLVMFNNNISIEDENDPFAEPKKIYNGQFAEVIHTDGNLINKTIPLKNGNSVNLNFRETTLLLPEVNKQVKILSFENYQISPKAKLSEDEIIALKIILNKSLSEFKKNNPFDKSKEYLEVLGFKDYQSIEEEIEDLKNRIKKGERVKVKLDNAETEQRKLLNVAKRKYNKSVEYALRKDTTADYYRFKNAAYLRLGWAMTVHKSTSYKWQEVIFNVDHGERTGKNNEQHFKWLYTGITRAKQRITLLNYKPIISAKYYAYIVNNKCEITESWEDCKKNISGVEGEKHKSFKTREEAEYWLNGGSDRNVSESKPASLKIKYYAYVARDARGVTENWDSCQQFVKGVPGAIYKKFETKEEAERWLGSGADYNQKHIASESGIYFDAGTGGGMGVEISVTDEKGNNLLNKVLSDDKLSQRGKHLIKDNVTNNFGELLACKYALQIASQVGIGKIFGDSDLVIKYWSKGIIDKKTISPNTLILAGEVNKLRNEFERKGGEMKHISGGSNPADLGFHK